MARRKIQKKRSRGALILNKNTRLVMVFSYIQGSPEWRSWSFRSVSQAKAEEMEKAGEAKRIIRRDVDGVVKTVGWQMQQPLRAERPSPTTLTMSTMNAVANNEPGQRLTRGETAHVLKFRSWPLIGDTKAVAVRPRITVAERFQAECLLGMHGEGARKTEERMLTVRPVPMEACA